MSDSEEDASPVKPSDPKIEKCLRGIVLRLFSTGKHDQLTVKRVRAAAETELKLQPDFLRSDAKWKDESKNIIQDAVVSFGTCDKDSPPS